MGVGAHPCRRMHVAGQPYRAHAFDACGPHPYSYQLQADACGRPVRTGQVLVGVGAHMHKSYIDYYKYLKTHLGSYTRSLYTISYLATHSW